MKGCRILGRVFKRRELHGGHLVVELGLEDSLRRYVDHLDMFRLQDRSQKVDRRHTTIAVSFGVTLPGPPVLTLALHLIIVQYGVTVELRLVQMDIVVSV